jgi:hypothetical protein
MEWGHTAQVHALNALLLWDPAIERGKSLAQDLGGGGVLAHALQHVATEAIRDHCPRFIAVELLHPRKRLLRILYLHMSQSKVLDDQ